MCYRSHVPPFLSVSSSTAFGGYLIDSVRNLESILGIVKTVKVGYLKGFELAIGYSQKLISWIEKESWVCNLQEFTSMV